MKYKHFSAVIYFSCLTVMSCLRFYQIKAILGDFLYQRVKQHLFLVAFLFLTVNINISLHPPPPLPGTSPPPTIVDAPSGGRWDPPVVIGGRATLKMLRRKSKIQFVKQEQSTIRKMQLRS
jgi:hypothetical protein